MAKQNFLDIDSAPLNKLLMLQNDGEDQDLLVPTSGSINPQPKAIKVHPLPGLCIKCKDGEGCKYFVNICTVKEIPPPAEMSESDLVNLLINEEQVSYRIPLSAGDPHPEKDKSGKDCNAYDILINPSFLKKIVASKVFEEFFVSVCFQSLEDKYGVTVDKNSWVILKNKKYHGKMPNHYIQNRLVHELDVPHPNFSQDVIPIENQTKDEPLIKEIKSSYFKSLNHQAIAPVFEFVILQYPDSGAPITLIVMIHVPSKYDSSSIDLSMNDERVLLTHDNVSCLDIFLPMQVCSSEVMTQFSVLQQILMVTVPLKK